MSARLTATVTAFVLAASGSVFAADIPVKAPPAAPAPIYNWTGWYAGVNLGASFGRVKTEFNVDPVTVSAAGRTIATIPGFDQSDVSDQVDSSVVVKLATIGSSPPFGSWGLRPTYKALSKKTAPPLPVPSTSASL
jgi:hypothetical protein